MTDGELDETLSHGAGLGPGRQLSAEVSLAAVVVTIQK